jgi:serine/threonine protein kinase
MGQHETERTTAEAGADEIAPPAGPCAELIRLIAEVISRRDRGEFLTDAQVIADHPELMPELLDELDGLRIVHRAFAAGMKATPIRAPLSLVSLGQFDAPILPDDVPEPEAETKRLYIPGYQVFREISSGGQGAVHKALQDSTGKIVAIKVLPGGPLAGSRDRGRFDREAEILASLDHPNIVGILDRGRTADGSFYFVMQYVDGKSLDDYANTCRADVGAGMLRLIDVFLKLARAVGEAHARGIVHRDLKPSNILIDGRDEPHLLDFGLARALASNDACMRARTITVAGQVVGSLPWASPEQVSGSGAELDTRSDVYSLGVCLYQCLTGNHPYSLHGSISDLINRIRFATPAPVGKLPGLNAGAIQSILDRALSKAPAERYATASALVADLEALISGTFIQRPRLRRRPAHFLVALLCLTLVAWTSWQVWPRGKPRPPVTIFKLPGMVNSAGMKLVLIPHGGVIMGTPYNAKFRGDDEREHQVVISRSFWISTGEVTRGQFSNVMPPPPTMGASLDDDLPVTGVTWEQAIDFCRLLSEREGFVYRLPTEAEWEYASRAGSLEAWAGLGEPNAMGWTVMNSGNRLHRPAEKQANHWGLYDMHGNAAEWCWDWYNPIYPLTQIDPVFRDRSGRRVVRGGSYNRPETDSRSASRSSERPDVARPDIGFRVVREEPATTRPTTAETK